MIRPGSDDPILAALRGRSVLVTGARGFIGSALCRALLEAGAEVHGTTRGEIPQDVRAEFHAGVDKSFTGGVWRELMQRIDVFYRAALA